ncbi:MAG TPA: peptidase dimerization domain-containing protein, partial [Leptospiraceae bacterium]|nr:peptidase dimerization domain-containing protein [Leptospiraceae bacterium]HMZ67578.1 peptidase dimerization domain-containing protein [Leptospiraceae bacterium]
ITAEKGSLAGINTEVAMIGVAEKGFLAAKIIVKGKGGHSSMPPSESAMGNAAKLMLEFEKNQIPQRLTPIIQSFFQNVGGSMSFPTRFSIANQWILSPLLLRQLANSPAGNAISRTTTALTMMKGSDGANVISPEVEFVVNFRILPGDTVEDVRNHIKKITQGYDIVIEEIGNTRGASIVSRTDTKPYKSLEKVIQAIYPNAIVTPYITIGGTDAFKYEKLSENIFRFNPVRLDAEERASIHNFNESIRVENFQRTIHYYRLLIQELNQ